VLTADLVDVRKKDGEITLPPLDAKKRLRVVAIATAVLDTVRAAEGRPRSELEAALDALDVGAREHRLKDGLVKLALDDAKFEEPDIEAAEVLRREVFMLATARRREHQFDREALLAEVSAAHATTPDLIEHGLFADLREAHTLLSAPHTSPAALADRWDRGRAQAVLLRAVRVTVMVKSSSPHAARALFRQIKFLRLLCTITREGDAHKIAIDGPASLFESSTKYGLQLAMLVPALDACDAYALQADVLWGKDRERYVFQMGGGRGAAGDVPEDPVVRDLVTALEKLGAKARPSTEVLDLPGVGLCVPDLEIEREGKKIHVELLGFWSRDAVWKRVELVEKGLAPNVVFAASARLRVSEEVLPDDAPSALYVYKGVVSPRALLEKVDAVARRSP
jgi:predicted nuclease of restriction endonuclease-like RecB superfamily